MARHIAAELNELTPKMNKHTTIFTYTYYSTVILESYIIYIIGS